MSKTLSRILKTWSVFMGLFYAFAGSVCINLGSVFLKKLDYISPVQILTIRNCMMFAACLPFTIYKSDREVLSRKQKLSLIATSLSSNIAILLSFVAVRYLPLATAITALSTQPIFTIIIARIMIKESCGLLQIICMLFTFCGVVLSVRLPEVLHQGNGMDFNDMTIIGLASAIGFSVIISLNSVMIRQMKYIYVGEMLSYFGFFGAIESAVILYIMGKITYPFCGRDNILYMMISTLNFLGSASLTFAYQIESAGVISVSKNSVDVVIGVLFQILLFNEIPDAYNLSGSALVLFSLLTIGFRNWLLTLPDETPIKKKFVYIL